MLPDDDFDLIMKCIIDRKNDYYRIALSFCGNGEDAMDAVSDMTVIVIEKFESLKNKDVFFSWSTQILVNICRQQMRRQKRVVYLEDMETELEDPHRTDEISLDIRAALSSIKPIYREVVILKSALHYTCREIAAMMHIPIGTVESRFDYAMKSLRKKLGEDYIEKG